MLVVVKDDVDLEDWLLLLGEIMKKLISDWILWILFCMVDRFRRRESEMLLFFFDDFVVVIMGFM